MESRKEEGNRATQPESKIPAQQQAKSASEQQQNQNHNTKKVSLGPNTKR